MRLASRGCLTLGCLDLSKDVAEPERKRKIIGGEFIKVFDESVFTCVPNLIGTPAFVANGVQLMGKHFSESVLLSLANSVERKGE